MFSEELGEFVVCKPAGLRETVESFLDADKSFVTRPDDAGAIAFDEVGRDLDTGEPHVLVMFEVTAKVKVLDIEGAQVGSFRDGGIEKEFDGLHVGGPGSVEAGVVSNVAAVGATNTAVKGTIGSDFDFDLRVVIGGCAIGRFEAEIEPVHSSSGFDETDDFVGFLDAPKVKVRGGTCGPVG